MLPSHSAFSHDCASELSPGQGNPCSDGLGEVHDRVLVFVSDPHAVEHLVQALHTDHPPSISSSPPFDSKYDNKKEYRPLKVQF